MTSATIGRRGLLAGLAAAGASHAFAEAPKPKVIMRTNHGSITVELEAQRAPLTCANFLNYVDHGGYNDGEFFRAARDPGQPGHGSIVGAPSPKVHRYPPIAHEPTTKTGLRHKTGTISLGRYDPGTATADFFICASPEPYLDAHPGAPGDNLGYAAFGQVISGMDVVRTILALPTPGFTKFKDLRGQYLKPVVPIYSMRRV